MLEDIRTLLHRALETKRGDQFALIRVPKRLVRGVNRALGSPLARPAVERQSSAPTVDTAPTHEPAPVMVYMEKDRNIRERVKIEEALCARNITYRLLDVSEDPSTKAFVVQAAQCEEDDLPVVFVGGEVVGCYNDLVQWDVSGRLTRAVFGGA